MRKKTEECGSRLELVDWTHLEYYLGWNIKVDGWFEEDVDWY